MFAYEYNYENQFYLRELIMPILFSFIMILLIVSFIVGIIKGFKSKNAINIILITTILLITFFILLFLYEAFEMHFYLTLIFSIIYIPFLFLKTFLLIKEKNLKSLLILYLIMLGIEFAYFYIILVILEILNI